MLTLQSTFTYGNGSETLPVDEAVIHLQHTTVQIEEIEGENTVQLIRTESGHLTFTQRLASQKYAVNVPAEAVFGPQWISDLEKYFSSFSASGVPLADPADLTLSFRPTYGTRDAAAQSNLEALWFMTTQARTLPRPSLASSDDPVPARAFMSMAVARKEGDGDLSLAAKIKPSLFLVNKAVFNQYLENFFPTLLPEQGVLLLLILGTMADLSGAVPSLSRMPRESLRAAVDSWAGQYGLNAAPAGLFDKIYGNFADFFDFPLKMPAVKPLVLAGQMRVRLPAGQAAVKVNFDLYTLTAEFEAATAGDGDTKVLVVCRYPWDPPTEIFEGHVQFHFQGHHMLHEIRSDVRVRVKAFDGSELYLQSFRPFDPQLEGLNIEVEARVPSVIQDRLGGMGSTTNGKKLRGKVVSLSSACTLKGTIIVQTKVTNADDSPWITVSSGESDKAGNFALPYPFGQYSRAVARISLDAKTLTTIAVDPSRDDESISSDFVYIVLEETSDSEDKDGTKSKDCNCVPMARADRIPDADQLIQSDQYMQDLGGGCINLTVPNRIIREYSYHALVRFTDPDVANYTMSSFEAPMPGTQKFKQTVYRLKSNGKITRKGIDLDNPVQWQDITDDKADLAAYQAVTIATGHVLSYRSEFRADGYSLGDLLYSLPLAPGQKKQIVTLDASHSLVGTEGQSLTQSEDLKADLMNDRVIVDNIAGDIGENLHGSSSASTAGVSATGSASASAGAYGGSVGVSGGYSNSKSSASQNSGRTVSQFFSEQLKQTIQQNATSYRHLNATVVTAVQEDQKYNAETTVVTNHNHCHSFTMMYFEVLRHFAVFQKLVDVEECVFVPLLMTHFGMENISKWADVLSTRLRPISANTYLRPRLFGGIRRHPLLPAFDAVERVRTEWKMVDYPDTSYDQEIMNWVDGELRVMTEIPRPKTKYDYILSLPVITKTVTHKEFDEQTFFKDGIVQAASFGTLGGDGTKTREEQVLAREQIFDAFMKVDANFESVPPSRCIRIFNFDAVPGGALWSSFDPTATFLQTGTQEWAMWTAYAEILSYGTGTEGVRRLLKEHFQNQLIGDWDTIFNTGIAPKVYKHMVGSLNMTVGGDLDTTAMTKYTGGERVMTANFSQPVSVKRADVSLLKITSTSTVAKRLKDTPATFTIQRLRMNYSTEHYNGLLYNGPVNGDIFDDGGVFCHTPVTAAEKKSPKDEDRFLCQRLITHLNQNIEYYNRVLLYSLDAQRRYLLLDGFEIEAFDKYGRHEGYRSLASVLKNTLIGVAGNSLVFPVAPGYKVNQSLIVESDGDGDRPESLLDHYRSDIMPPPYRLSVPTKGVYSEAMMGQCDACEMLKPDSSQDWTKFTTDESTPIAAPQPPVPTVTNYQPQIPSFAPPLVAIQNSPAVPAPAAGLADLTQVLGKSDTFRDITGLQGAQGAAMHTYGSQAAALEAIRLTRSRQATADADKKLATISKAVDMNLLTNPEHKDVLTYRALEEMNGPKPPEQTSPLQDEAVQAVIQAAQEGGFGTAIEASNAQGNVRVQVSDPTEAAGFGPAAISRRPKFEDFKVVYPDFKRYNKEQVKQLVGGDVNSDWVNNTCTVRISRALQYAQDGFTIPARAETGDPGSEPGLTVKGADGKNYIIRAPGMHALLTARWGRPKKWKVKAGENLLETLENTRGVIAFGDKHYDLFDGTGITSKGDNPNVQTGLEYFVEYVSKKDGYIRFWELP